MSEKFEGLEFVEGERIPFDVTMVKVTLENVDVLARWCKGKVVDASYKMMGTTAMLPAIQMHGPSSKREPTLALIGQWVVKQQDVGSFRVYREEQLKSTFQEKKALSSDLTVAIGKEALERLEAHAAETFPVPDRYRVVDMAAQRFDEIGSEIIPKVSGYVHLRFDDADSPFDTHQFSVDKVQKVDENGMPA